MAVSLTTVRGRLLALFNASTVFGTNDDTQRWDNTEPDKAILAADGEVVAAICANRLHGHRKAFLTGSTAGVANGATLADRVGPLEQVKFVITGGEWAGTHPGTELLRDHLRLIARENRNPNANAYIEPHYCVDGDTLWHNGAGLVAGGASSVSVDIVFAVYSNNGTSCQSPDEYEDAIVAIAAGKLIPKEGHHIQAGAVFAGQGAQYINQIAGGAMTIEPLRELEKAA